MREQFRRFAHRVSVLSGTPWAFLLAVLVIVVWAITGPLFGFSDTWQLVINTGTTVVTFLMVFLIQNTQNRDSLALHLKLDELIRAVRTARNQLVDLEDLSDTELRQLQREFERLRHTARKRREEPLEGVAMAAERAISRERGEDRGEPAEAGDEGVPSERPRRRRRRRGGRGRSSPS